LIDHVVAWKMSCVRAMDGSASVRWRPVRQLIRINGRTARIAETVDVPGSAPVFGIPVVSGILRRPFRPAFMMVSGAEVVMISSRFAQSRRETLETLRIESRRWTSTGMAGSTERMRGSAA